MLNVKAIFSWLRQKKENVYIAGILCLIFCFSILMYVRAFYGTEITDEAFYISDALHVLDGNIPYVYNNASIAVGSTFLLVPILFLYKLMIPSLEGMVLVTRLCFVTFRLIILYIIYRILKKHIRRCHALLIVLSFIPFSGATIGNYSYNTVPLYMMLLAAFLLYDYIEQSETGSNYEMALAGFSSAIACFANPGYGIGFIVFLAIILLRARGAKRVSAIKMFMAGFGAEILIVVVPIVFQTSLGALMYGLYRKFIHPYPVEALNPNKNYRDIVLSFWGYTKQFGKILIVVAIPVYLFARRYVHENKIPLSRKSSISLAVFCSFAANLAWIIWQKRGNNFAAQLGYAAALYLIVFCFAGIWKKNKLIFYIGLYPVVFSLAEIILVSSGADIGRFYYSFPVLIVIFVSFLQSDSELTRLAATLTLVMLVVANLYSSYKYVYRDQDICFLDHKVASGVYKGLYTTADRAHDLTELEEYLNSVIGEDEAYAFRDNVPCAYLMMHHGIMCEPSSWDTMNYRHGRNAPAVMFDYYRRRDRIPDKIIYIDYGMNEFMSIEGETFRYNDFVNANYNLVDDLSLNSMFFHIMVYENNGNFDGNYDYWIDSYYELIGKK